MNYSSQPWRLLERGGSSVEKLNPTILGNRTKRKINFIKTYHMQPLHFEFSQEEFEQIEFWKKSLPPPVEDVFGEAYCYEYIFYPTGLGLIKRVRRMDGFELDLTDYAQF